MGSHRQLSCRSHGSKRDGTCLTCRSPRCPAGSISAGFSIDTVKRWLQRKSSSRRGCKKGRGERGRHHSHREAHRMNDRIRIASGQGFWGDLLSAPKDQVTRGPIDYLVMDYLAEVTMSILQKQKLRDPSMGYAR